VLALGPGRTPACRYLLQESTVLTITMQEDSAEDLAASIRRSCSLFGTVTKVQAYPKPSDATVRPFALISMATREQAETLAAAFGGRTLGRTVMLVLQKPAGGSVPPRSEIQSQA
jgi:hypothetical protein